MDLADARLAGAGSDSGLLAAELDAAGCPHLLSLLSALARIHPGSRCSGLEPNGNFALGAFTKKFCIPVFNLGVGLVVV